MCIPNDANVASSRYSCSIRSNLSFSLSATASPSQFTIQFVELATNRVRSSSRGAFVALHFASPCLWTSWPSSSSGIPRSAIGLLFVVWR
mmetsp:Transcript_2795/g.8189  ORF Transcript_2795/g.8189 Transcript_2795/m.8189 type:complete len:90 (-) Transcript_2795:304-573(-)